MLVEFLQEKCDMVVMFFYRSARQHGLLFSIIRLFVHSMMPASRRIAIVNPSEYAWVGTFSSWFYKKERTDGTDPMQL